MKKVGLVLLVAAALAGCGPGSGQMERPTIQTQAPARVESRPAPAPSHAGALKVVFVDGEVTADAKPLQIGDVLPDGVVVKTGRASTCQLVFSGRNIISVRANTVVSFNSEKLARTAELKSGALGFVLRELPKIAGEPGFQVKTAQAVAGVRGTVFFIRSEGTRTYECTCNGDVSVSSSSDRQQVQSPHHAARYILADGTIQTAPMVDHDDGEMEALAAKIGETIDWTRQE